jgi:hypothetical protein
MNRTLGIIELVFYMVIILSYYIEISIVCISTPMFCWTFVGMLSNQGFQINSFKQL